MAVLLSRLFPVVLSLAFSSSSTPATSATSAAHAPRDGPRDEYERKRFELLVQAGQRHLELGVWCRDQGLVAQASAEFLCAVEVSESRNPGAVTVLSMMRMYDEAFWRKIQRPPSSTHKLYEPKARKLVLQDQRDRLDLAAWASRNRLDAEARSEYENVLRARDAALELDDKGRITVEAGVIPAKISEELRKSAISINGRLYLRDEFLSHLPELKSIDQAESEDLRVRSPLGHDLVADLLALGQALLPVLERDLAGRPTRRLNLFVFADRATYDAYLDAAGLGDHKGPSGLADRQSFTAMVCAEDRSGDDLRALVLHELTHLFARGCSRAVMPSWYDEGLAERYGGQGSFTWDGKSLSVGGRLAGFRIEALRSPERSMGLRDVLTADARALFQADPEQAHAFYAHAWALLRYLREGAEPAVRRRFEEWERMCAGAAVGAKVGEPRASDRGPADELFVKILGGDMEKLEDGFRKYLQGL